jgi:hypothetical protein
MVALDAFGAASLFALGPGGLDDYRPAMAWFDQRPQTRDPGPINWHRFPNANAVGGLLVRAGRIDEAVAHFTEGLAAGGKARSEESPNDWAYLALAHERKPRIEEARMWLERLRRWRPDPRASFWGLRELDLLRDEAESLIRDAEFPSDPFPRRGP